MKYYRHTELDIDTIIICKSINTKFKWKQFGPPYTPKYWSISKGTLKSFKKKNPRFNLKEITEQEAFTLML